MVVAGGGLVAIAAAIFGEEIDMGTVDYALNLEEELIISRAAILIQTNNLLDLHGSSNSTAKNCLSNTFPSIQ